MKMAPLLAFVKTHARALFSASAIVASYTLVGLEHPTATFAERSRLAERFAFEARELPPALGMSFRTIDQLSVHPDVEHMKAWVAGAGAGVALGDLDGDGLPNDTCFVDPRVDVTIIEPVPGTGDRFAAIPLEPRQRAADQPVQFPTGCLIADLDEDGWQDLVVYYATRPPVAFWHTGSGVLTSRSYVAQELVPGEEVWATAAGIVADIDGDGHLDLMFGNYFPNGSRIYDPNDHHPIQLNDSLSSAANGGTTEILLWDAANQVDQHGIRFRRAQHVLPEPIDRGWTLALAAADFTGRLLPDIYVANDFGPDRFLHNVSTPGHPAFQLLEGQRSFSKPKSKVLGHDSFKSMGVDVADLDGDGRLDFAVSNITSDFAFQESNFTFMNTGDVAAVARGVAPFTDESEGLGLSRSGFSWDVRFGDFDNSGTQQLLQATGFIKGVINQVPGLHESAIANDSLVQFPAVWPRYDGRHDLSGHEPNRFWVRGQNGRFIDIGSELAITTDAVTRGIATADMDGDGRLDFASADQWGPSYVYHNICDRCGNFLGVHVRFPLLPQAEPSIVAGHPAREVPSRPAIGALARVESPDGRVQIGFVDASNGHSGKRAPDLHFGLGDLSPNAALTVSIEYRDPRGHVRHTRLQLSPGWHTVFLPWSAEED
jgi:enediyne biosynthesis protein E4